MTSGWAEAVGGASEPYSGGSPPWTKGVWRALCCPLGLCLSQAAWLALDVMAVALKAACCCMNSSKPSSSTACEADADGEADADAAGGANADGEADADGEASWPQLLPLPLSCQFQTDDEADAEGPQPLQSSAFQELPLPPHLMLEALAMCTAKEHTATRAGTHTHTPEGRTQRTCKHARARMCGEHHLQAHMLFTQRA